MSLSTDTQPTFLVVDDKKNMLSLMAKVLRKDGDVLTADSGEAAIRLLETEDVDVVLCDLKMGDADGLDVLKACKRYRPRAEFILMTAFASVPTAVEALRMGAYDYLTKPFDPEAARTVVLRSLGRASVPAAADGANAEQGLPGVVAGSKPMRDMADLVRKVARSDATVLLLGETGTGKERIARAVHQLSPRSHKRFVAVNCAAIPADLLESELFGYAKGSFTGAGREKTGLFEEAEGGTLFLDEIGDMGVSLQAKLTRALEERAIRRIGESRERPVDVRLVAATHRDVKTMVTEGSFREDLWYRLNVAVVHLPPLRDRSEDVELLAAHFLGERAAADPSRKLAGFTPAALGALVSYSWPGNVRQLRSAIERASVVSVAERIDVGDLPPEVIGTGPRDKDVSALADLPWSEAMERGRADVAKAYLEELLKRSEGNVAAASSLAGVERESFYRLMRRYGVRKP